MVVASLTWQLALPGCSSLKEKRATVRSLKDRLRARFHLSVAETGFQELHAKAQISVAIVSSDRRFAQTVLDKADHLVQEHPRAIVVASSRDLH